MKPNRNGAIRVAVSGFDGLDNPHPGLALAGALRQEWDTPIEIDALGYDALMTGAWMPGVADELHVMPLPSDGDDATFDRLMEIHARRPLDVVIPSLDLDVPVYSRIASRLDRTGIRTLLPAADSVYRVSKLRLPKLCRDIGVRTPRTIHVLELGDLPLHADQFGYPLVVKGTVAGAKVVGGANEAVTEARKLNEKWGGGVLLQDFVAGEEFVAAAVADHGSEPLGLVIMRKLGVSEIGKGVYGAVVDDPRIVSAAKQILRQLNWRGPLELEFILPNGAKAPILVEINCRFPSWIMLTHWAGANLPALLLREILQPGRSGPCAAKAGTSFIRDIVETAVPHGELRNLQRGRNCVGTPMDTPSIRRGDPDGVRVAISGVGTFDVVNAGLGVGRALRLAPDIAAIYGLGYGNFDSGLYRNDLFDIAFLLPASDDPSALLRRLTEIHGEMPFDVIIPCLDGEIPRYIEIRRALEKLGVRMLLPSIESFERCTKTALFCGHVREDWGSFSVPQAIQVRSEDEVETAADGVGFPVAVKGPISHALRADNMAEAGAAWTILRDKGLREALVQPYIEGDQFAVAAVCGTDSRPIAMMTIKKLRMCGRGSTWSAVRIEQPRLEADFSEFLRAIEWVGPVEGEFIRNETYESFHLIEVNPRFTAWIAFSAFAGSNHPYLAVCAALGRSPSMVREPEDLVFMRSCEDVHLDPTTLAALATKGTLRHA